MSKPWTFQEDCFLSDYYEAVGATVISMHDLKRSVSAIKIRWKLINDTGARDCILKMRRLETEYLHCLGKQTFDEKMGCPQELHS